MDAIEANFNERLTLSAIVFDKMVQAREVDNKVQGVLLLNFDFKHLLNHHLY